MTHNEVPKGERVVVEFSREEATELVEFLSDYGSEKVPPEEDPWALDLATDKIIHAFLALPTQPRKPGS